MNFKDYNKIDATLKSDNSSLNPTSVEYVTGGFTSKTSEEGYLSQTPSSVGTEIEFDFNKLVPSNSNVIRKSITVWADQEGTGNRKIAAIYDNMSRKAVIDAKYSNLEYEVRIDYENSTEGVISLEDTVKASNNKSVSLKKTTPSKSFNSIEDFVIELKNEINFLKTRVSDLENK